MAMYTSLEGFGIAVLAILGVYFVKKVLCLIYTYAIGPAINKVDFKSKGKWALVTGSTDGIGKQYAKELAARGCNIVLVSRSIDKLNNVAEEIRTAYNVETKVVQADFGNEDIYDNIEKEVADLEIGTLVNNVGVSYAYPEYFIDVPDWEKTQSNLVRANMVSAVRVTKLILPGMLKRGKGVVINISSASSIVPSPLLTTYAASKAFINKFSEGLKMEYNKRGIIVQCVQPGFVCSNMSGIKRSSFFAPTADVFVKSAIGLVGTTSETTGYFPHMIFVNVINGIQKISYPFAVWLVTRNMENSRRLMLRKYKKQ